MPNHGGFMEDNNIDDFLFHEDQNRQLTDNGSSLHGVIARATGQTNNDVRKSFVDLLKRRENEFMAIINSLDEHAPVNNNEETNKEFEKRRKEYFTNIQTECKRGRDWLINTNMSLFWMATLLNRPIYVLANDEMNELSWNYFPYLFECDTPAALSLLPEYICVFMSTNGNADFFEIISPVEASTPKAIGKAGMFRKNLADTSLEDIHVPCTFIETRSKANIQSKLTAHLSSKLVEKITEELTKRNMLDEYQITTLSSHRPTDKCIDILVSSDHIFELICKILMREYEKEIIEILVSYDKVSECDILRKWHGIITLEDALRKLETMVANVLIMCGTKGDDFDTRRKVINKTVIGSSIVGIIGGGLGLAGIILIPVTFGVSLGLTIAGGVIGVSSGVVSGGSRVVEAVKQNSGVNDIKAQLGQLTDCENAVGMAYKELREMFANVIQNQIDTEEVPGISLRGFLAIGGAVRVAKSGAEIALASIRIGATGATVAASVLGPVSLIIDIGFLIEASHNKVKGDKTQAGEKVRHLASVIEMKHKILYSELCGDQMQIA